MRVALVPISAIALVASGTAPAAAIAEISLEMRGHVAARCSLVSMEIEPRARASMDVSILCNAAYYRVSVVGSEEIAIADLWSPNAFVRSVGDAAAVSASRPGIQTLHIALTRSLSPAAVAAVEVTAF